jgi:hypothetical protein
MIKVKFLAIRLSIHVPFTDTLTFLYRDRPVNVLSNPRALLQPLAFEGSVYGRTIVYKGIVKNAGPLKHKGDGVRKNEDGHGHGHAAKKLVIYSVLNRFLNRLKYRLI